MRLALLLLASCGGYAPRILPPNTELACDHAIVCGVFTQQQLKACVNCIETVADKWNAEADAAFKGHPPELESIPCDVTAQIARETNLTQCVNERWYGQ